MCRKKNTSPTVHGRPGHGDGTRDAYRRGRRFLRRRWRIENNPILRRPPVDDESTSPSRRWRDGCIRAVPRSDPPRDVDGIRFHRAELAGAAAPDRTGENVLDDTRIERGHVHGAADIHAGHGGIENGARVLRDPSRCGSGTPRAGRMRLPRIAVLPGDNTRSRWRGGGVDRERSEGVDDNAIVRSVLEALQSTSHGGIGTRVRGGVFGLEEGEKDDDSRREEEGNFVVLWRKGGGERRIGSTTSRAQRVIFLRRRKLHH